MENQIQKTEGTSLWMPLKTGNNEIIGTSHFSEPKLSEVPQSEIKVVLKKVIVLLGIKKENLPNDIQKAVMLDFLQSNYNITLLEFYKAFELALIGELSVETTVYQNFSCEYISSILNAYKKYVRRNSIYTGYLSQKQKEEEGERAELIRKANEDFLQNKYNIFQELLSETENTIKEKGVSPISLDVDSEKVGFFVSAINHFEGGLCVSGPQLNWINTKVSLIDVPFDPQKFGNGTEGKRKHSQFIEIEKSNFKKRLGLEFHFANKLSQSLGASVNDILNFSTYQNENP